MSIDPVTTDAKTGASFNRYAYANNSPYKYIDPDGRDNEDPFVFVPLAAEQFRPHGEMMFKAVLEVGKYYVAALSLMPEVAAAERVVAAGVAVGTAAKATEVAAPTAAQAKNIQRFTSKLPANAKDSVTVKPLPNGGVAAQGVSPGRVPGSAAQYEKQIDSAEKTIQYTKTTTAPDGTIVHVKDKITGNVIP